MRRTTLVLAPALACLLGSSAATPADTSPPPRSHVLQYEVAELKGGQVLNTVWGWSESVENEPERVAAISRTIFTKGGEWWQRAIFTNDQPPRCLSWEGKLKDNGGTILVNNHTQWVPEAFPQLDRPLPSTTYPMEGMGYALTHLGLGMRQKTSIYTVLAGSLMQLDLWIDGRETLQLPAGEFDTYRVHLRANAQFIFPNLPAFVRPVVSFFIPTYTMWLTVSEPQTLVKFVGQMGPPGSPELLMRLLAVSDTPP